MSPDIISVNDICLTDLCDSKQDVLARGTNQTTWSQSRTDGWQHISPQDVSTRGWGHAGRCRDNSTSRKGEKWKASCKEASVNWAVPLPVLSQSMCSWKYSPQQNMSHNIIFTAGVYFIRYFMHWCKGHITNLSYIIEPLIGRGISNIRTINNLWFWWKQFYMSPWWTPLNLGLAHI